MKNATTQIRPNSPLTKLFRSLLLLIIVIDFFSKRHFIELFPFQNKQIELGDKMDLASYLLKPIQRMSKYALLLKDLIKECSQSQEQELSDLRTAEDMVKFQLRHGNDLLAMDAIRGCDVSSNQA